MRSPSEPSAHAFRLMLEIDSQAVVRALGPFAVAGLIPRRMTVEALGDALCVDAEFEGLDGAKADWLCQRVGCLPVVRSARRRPLP